MGNWFQLENWNASVRLDSAWNPFSLAKLRKFQLELITTVSCVEQHVICSALKPQLTYFQAIFCGSKNWNCVPNHPPTLVSLISKHVRLFFSQKKNPALFTLITLPLHDFEILTQKSEKTLLYLWKESNLQLFALILDCLTIRDSRVSPFFALMGLFSLLKPLPEGK